MLLFIVLALLIFTGALWGIEYVDTTVLRRNQTMSRQLSRKEQRERHRQELRQHYNDILTTQSRIGHGWP